MSWAWQSHALRLPAASHVHPALRPKPCRGGAGWRLLGGALQGPGQRQPGQQRGQSAEPHPQPAAQVLRGPVPRQQLRCSCMCRDANPCPCCRPELRALWISSYGAGSHCLVAGCLASCRHMQGGSLGEACKVCQRHAARMLHNQCFTICPHATHSQQQVTLVFHTVSLAYLAHRYMSWTRPQLPVPCYGGFYSALPSRKMVCRALAADNQGSGVQMWLRTLPSGRKLHSRFPKPGRPTRPSTLGVQAPQYRPFQGEPTSTWSSRRPGPPSKRCAGHHPCNVRVHAAFCCAK